MSTVDFEAAIKSFLALGKQLYGDAASVTGQKVLDALTSWYRTTRIAGATLEEDGDMLLLQWGAAEPQLGLDGPTDLRQMEDGEVSFEDALRQSLDFTRQVCPTDQEDDFDEAAVQMSITLFYQPAVGTEQPGSNSWIRQPKDIEAVVAKYKTVAYVKSLLTSPSTRMCITVDHCG